MDTLTFIAVLPLVVLAVYVLFFCDNTSGISGQSASLSAEDITTAVAKGQVRADLFIKPNHGMKKW